MPIIKREFYLSEERFEYFNKLPSTKRELFWDSLQDEIDRFVNNHRKGRQSTTPKSTRYQTTLVRQTEYVADNLKQVADKLGWTVLRTTRNAICDFLGLPDDHIDRQERSGEYTHYEYFTNITVFFYDGDTVKPHFTGKLVKQKFRHYFEQWCRNHLGE